MHGKWSGDFIFQLDFLQVFCGCAGLSASFSLQSHGWRRDGGGGLEKVI